MNDQVDPVIKEDSEYPEWLPSLARPLKSKKELLEEAEKVGMNAMDSRDLKLLKRRLTKETILENNISGGKV
eukprot:CAMPEP_0185026404 /NCGR_PEP_ID=MMETSP1103-20130426/10533_1 /TAXON_ID=36769 /ORGANISM="Paraphysomonas bandaiensis, Strain Caron Lab Isolate" /LENGTH=71 /DNA_ID=CAMNT_0027559971 /DNA_START=133 /DNA_END=348 /DNA_ORIENTATION=-